MIDREVPNPYLVELKTANRLPDIRERRKRIVELFDACDASLDVPGSEGDFASEAYTALRKAEKESK